MKILKAIGNFFVKIWRWIKNTAWVQPLLIVGAIFGVIFSIPAITSGIQGLINSNNSADKFYKNYKKSLEGGATSSAEKLLDNYLAKDKDKETKLNNDEMKYFVMFTAKNNSTASDIKPGFQTLKEKWSDFGLTSDYPFKLYTVYTDEVTAETTKMKSAFYQFNERKNWFFIDACKYGKESYYCINKGVTETDLDKLVDAEVSNFITPTIIFVDWTESSKLHKHKEGGIVEVMFNVPGANSYDKASLLADCWAGRGKFGPDYPGN